MGSITKTQRVEKRTGKTITVFRAYVRREGFASKSKVCATLRDAKEWLRNNDGDEAQERATSGVTVKALVPMLVEAPPSRGSKYWTAGHLDFWAQQIGHLKAAEVSRGDINAAKAVLQTKMAMRSTPGGAQVTERTITPATVNRYLASLSSLFNWALENEIIDAHPMKGGKVKKLTESGGRTRILTADEEARLMSEAQRSRWPMLPLFIRLCLTTASRRSEVLNLKWQAVQLDDHIAVLGKTKNGRPRAMPLVADVRQSLAEAKKVRPLHSDFVFFNPRRPSEAFNVDTVWTECRKAAGLLNDRDDPLDRVVLHSTRHTAVNTLPRPTPWTWQRSCWPDAKV